MFSNHANVSAGSKNGSPIGRNRRADDLRTPDGILENSRFSTSNISAKLGIKPFKNHEFRLQYQRNWSKDVGIPGGDAFPGPATATYTDIGRHLFSANYKISNITSKWTSVELKYFTQYIVRDVEMKPNQVTEVTMPNSNIQRTSPQVFIHRIASDKRRAGAGYLGFVAQERVDCRS